MIGEVGSWSDPTIKQLPDFQLPLIRDLPVVEPLLSSYNLIVYFSWFATLALYVILFHTRFGRLVRAVGENQAAAEAVGINVLRVKVFALMLGDRWRRWAGLFFLWDILRSSHAL